MHKTRLTITLILALFLPTLRAYAIPMQALADSLSVYANNKAEVGKVSVKSIRTKGRTARIYTCKTLSWLSLSQSELKDLRRKVSVLVFGDTGGDIQIYSDGYELGELVTLRHRSIAHAHTPAAVQPLVRNADLPYQCPDGLDGRHIALWGSHGWYYNNQMDRWLWQRARLWTTVEDLFTSSYTMPYLVPMLENAGAVVLQPRERDTQTAMVIIDSTALRTEGEKTIAETIVPDEGEYAVYIWYEKDKQASNHTELDIEHKDRTTHYHLNMQIGAGTWVYVGTHAFSPQQTARISIHTGKEHIRAIRLGGGIDTLANVPRYVVGASQYLHFAGIPDSILDYTQGENTYTNDYACRGQWVNYLLSGSQLAPKDDGLAIPIDLSLGLHSDAGIRAGDSIVGTLLIYYNRDDNKSMLLPLGDSRLHCRYLGDYVQTQVVEDMRALFAPNWTRRALKNAGYAEARQPRVPSILLEMLSHQNMNDMRLGLDPNVKFAVSRAIYKGILKYLATSRGTDYVVQPLPVSGVATALSGDSILLRWQPQDDPLEPTAAPSYYIVYTRRTRTVNGQTIAGDWSNGTRVNGTRYAFAAERGIRYDFRVVADNRGGVSLPSETLCAYLAPKSQGKILIINNFTRLSAPSFFADSTYAGICPQSYAVQEGRDIAFLGEQYDHLRKSEWQSDDNCGWGASYADQQFVLTAGNTRDYPLMHGKVLSELGYSYCSCSAALIEDTTALRRYDIIDLICGKQKTVVSNQLSAVSDQQSAVSDTVYEAFPAPLRDALTDYAQHGGKILLSGMYIGSEAAALGNCAFTRQVLRYTYRGDHATRSGKLLMNMQLTQLITTPNPDVICCENAQGILPARGAVPYGTYTDSGMNAGIAYDGEGKIIALPFIMESVQDFGALYRNCIYHLNK